MIYASRSLHWDSTYAHEATIRGGGSTVGADLLNAALASDDIAGAHVFADDRGLPDGALGLQPYLDARRIEWQHMALLPKLAEQHDYIWVAPSSSLNSAYALRRGLGRVAFPVCGIVTSLAEEDVQGRLALQMLRAEGCDMLVATNRSVRQALELAVDRAVEWLSQEGVSAVTRRPGIATVPIPVDTEAFRPRERQMCREILSLPKDKTLLLCAGESLRGSVDDLDPLLLVVKELAAKHEDLMLVIAGVHRGKYSLESEQLAAELGLPDRVEMFIELPAHVKRLLYPAVDIFVGVDATLDAVEGKTLAEAMACGLPAVVADWAVARDLMDDGVEGVLVPTYWNPVAAVMMSWLSACEWSTPFLADRTAVDVRTLREALAVLVAQPARRAQIGAAARQRLEANHALAKVGRSIASVWQNQRAMLARGQSVSREPIVDHTGLFKHYATSELELSTAVCLSDQGRRRLGDELHAPDTSGMPPLLRSAAAQLIEMAREGAVRIEDCAECGSEFTLEALVWLLRRGVLFHTEASADTNARADARLARQS